MKNNKYNKYNQNQNRTEHRINQTIRVPKVRLVGDNVENPGNVVDTAYAKQLAESMELDLVEISPNAEPPVVKILDYKKFLYEEKKRKKEQEKKSKENNKDLKEIRFTPNIGENDVNVKKKKIEEFLKDGHKVKLTVRYKGRELGIANTKSKGELILLSIAEDLSEICKVVEMPKLQGRNMYMNLAPKK
jgi:translation initiation factor IF-3